MKAIEAGEITVEDPREKRLREASGGGEEEARGGGEEVET